jgi:hypothetical protein
MKYIVYLLGFLWIAAGAAAILYTDEYKATIRRFISQTKRLYLALIPAVFGLLLLIAAPSTNYAWFIGLIGILGIAKGVVIYLDPAGLFARSQAWLESLSEQGYRLMGIIAMILGTVIISWIK